MTSRNRLVFVIDDDGSVRKGLRRLLRSADYESEVFESALIFWPTRHTPGRRA
jgi:FixJ family two-component response regulator